MLLVQFVRSEAAERNMVAITAVNSLGSIGALLSGVSSGTRAIGAGSVAGFGPAAIVDLGASGVNAAASVLNTKFFSTAPLPAAAVQQRSIERRRDFVEARSALVAGDFAKAREVAGRLLGRNPDDADATHLIARTHQAQGNTDEAIEFFNRAAQLAPGNARFLSDARNAQILQRSDGAVLKAAQGMLKTTATRADGLRLLSLLAGRSETSSILLALGDAFFDLRAKQQGLGAFVAALDAAEGIGLNAVLERADKVVADSPDAAIAHDFRGKVLQKLERFDEAITEFRKARDLEPIQFIYIDDLAGAFTARGRSRVAHGDLRGGKSDFLEARALRPLSDEINRDVAETRINLARQLMFRGALVSSLGELNSARATLPSGADDLKQKLAGLYFSLGNRFTSDNDNLTAASSLQSAYDLDGTLTHRTSLGQARNTLGLQFLGELRYQDAVDEFQKAVDLFPNIQEYQDNLDLAKSFLST